MKAKSNPKLASLIIRIGLAAVFAYAAIDAFREPAAWVGFIPPFSNAFIDPKLALDILSGLQLGLSVWLLSGRYTKYAAVVAIAFLGGLIITSPDAFLITFRDIGLIGAAAALWFLDES